MSQPGLCNNAASVLVGVLVVAVVVVVQQASLMLKIVLAQWMNTAFIIYFINNINEAPNEDYINQVRR